MNKKQAPQTIYKEIIRNNRVLVIINICVIGLLFLSIKNNNKPPLVIRYLPSGQAQVIENYANNNTLTHYDIEVFVSHFISRWNWEDSFSIQENIPKALNLMTADMRQKNLSKVTTSAINDVMKKNQKTITTIEKIQFKNKGDKIDAKVRYRRQIISFDNKPLKTIVKRMEFILKPLSERSSQYPYGVLVENFESFKLN